MEPPRGRALVPDWLRGPWGVLAAVCTAWIGGWLAAVWGGVAHAAEWLSFWSWPLMQGFALAACLRIALDRSAEARIRRAWLVPALAVALAATGDGIWTALALDGVPPFPSAAEPFYLASSADDPLLLRPRPAPARRARRPARARARVTFRPAPHASAPCRAAGHACTLASK